MDLSLPLGKEVSRLYLKRRAAKAALIYLASLELGPATVQDVSRKAGVTRTTVYNLIESLKEKGLIAEKTHSKPSSRTRGCKGGSTRKPVLTKNCQRI